MNKQHAMKWIKYLRGDYPKMEYNPEYDLFIHYNLVSHGFVNHMFCYCLSKEEAADVIYMEYVLEVWK